MGGGKAAETPKTVSNMIVSTLKWLEPELMDVVRLFEGAESLEIGHSSDCCGAAFRNTFRFGGRDFFYSDEDVSRTPLEQKSLIKRYAKLSLYKLLSGYYGKSLPWGSLTGIRPTRLAYQQMEKTGEFVPLFQKLLVSEENTALVGRVIEGQKGIYVREEGNVDLFVSLPFCPTKCVYCSFITAPIARTRQYMPAYLDALERELSAAAPLIKNLRSVYVGGGTPFAIEAEELERVLKAISPLRENGCEFTVEAGRPDTFTAEKLDICKKYGVTRICINAQSFSDRTLAAIGRKHTAQDVLSAFERASPYGFDVNCDLIAGLTGESFEEFKNSVDTAISLSPENITVHTLCLKKGAKLKEERLGQAAEGSGKPALDVLPDGLLSDMIAYSREKLTAAGYEPYYLYRQKYMAGAHENVGWTKPGKACVYNVDVMEEICDNLAVGANAITKKLFLKEERIERCGSPKDIPTYLQKVEKLIEEKNELFGG